MNPTSKHQTSRPKADPGMVVRGWLSDWEPPAAELPFQVRLTLFRLSSGRILTRIMLTTLLMTLVAGAVVIGIDDLLSRHLCCLA